MNELDVADENHFTIQKLVEHICKVIGAIQCTSSLLFCKSNFPSPEAQW